MLLSGSAMSYEAYLVITYVAKRQCDELMLLSGSAMSYEAYLVITYVAKRHKLVLMMLSDVNVEGVETDGLQGRECESR